ncbi:helix-turn-helix domain-containing protein [Paenibacillus eucommiae]|uniref:AraC-like DNA-binding protein n=1 Tax=Paenibacillus eucommiae TaxID=1355755 RepID=A0ABS4IXJ2_9BACL|nr:AraC family transcriptional regulator [Paenibacillus eucommiae]MBP1992283.1 AraC-like DNA-binding protein [Paenibacillus eucommiae]
MYPWGDYPDHVIKLDFLDVGTGQIHSGYIHEKTVPFVILAQATSGVYEVTSPLGTVIAAEGEVFLTPANIPLKILHTNTPSTTLMTYRFIHINFTLFESIDIFSIFSLPLKTTKEKGRQIGEMIDELYRLKVENTGNTTKSPLSIIVKSNEIAYRLLNVLLEISKPLEESLFDLQAYQAVAPVIMYIREHIGEPITLGDLMRQLPLSRSSFFQIFKQHFNKTPMDYVKFVRLNEGYRKLCSTEKSVAKIAEETGFSNPFHFSREFKKSFQKSPLQIRSMHKELFGSIHSF